jgi:hypothetical protein
VNEQPKSSAPARPSGLRLALQVSGFIVGCLLVAWCAQRAFAEGGDGLEKLKHADPMHVAVLIGATLGSIVCSGYTFWAVARPIRRFSVVEMQAVNLMASLFNYAPVRLGLVLRCAFHWRVERMPATDIGAWIAGVAVVTLGSIGAGLAAGLVQIAVGRDALALDWMWISTYVACLLAGSAAVVIVGRFAVLRRLLKGGERALNDPSALGGGLAIRTVDLAMWSLRMWAAAKIVGVTLSPAQAALLAAVAILGASNPLGRIGWREALVAFVAPYVVTGASSPEELNRLTSQLALLESAGEAILTIPLGVLGSLWCLRAMRAAGRSPSDNPTPSLPSLS